MEKEFFLRSKLGDVLPPLYFKLLAVLIKEHQFLLSDPKSIRRVIKQLEKESSNIIIPGVLKTEPRIIRKKRIRESNDLFDNSTHYFAHERKNIYEGGKSEEDVNKLIIEKKDIDLNILVLKEVLDKVEYYLPKSSTVNGFDLANDELVDNALPEIQDKDSKVNEFENDEDPTTGIELLRELIDKWGVDITEEVDPNKKTGNRKWRYTEGQIYIHIRSGLKGKLKKPSAIKEIQIYRGEKLNNSK